jgi:hypothetical protein
MMLIDPPVGPYSSADDIRAWLEELADAKQFPPDDESVKRAVAEAKGWLARAEAE